MTRAGKRTLILLAAVLVIELAAVCIGMYRRTRTQMPDRTEAQTQASADTPAEQTMQAESSDQTAAGPPAVICIQSEQPESSEQPEPSEQPEQSEQELPGEEADGQAVESAETQRLRQLAELQPEQTQACGATIWPVRDLPIYQDPSAQQTVGTASVQQAYTVAGELAQLHLFYIRTADGDGYVNSDFCMIDLPAYLGEMCSYDITNSYAAEYRVHGADLPGITGTVITGYEQVQKPDGSFFVPLLYPTANRLISAAQAAIEAGYRLKIYDAFRPLQATRVLYDTAQSLYDQPVAEDAFSGGLPGTEPGSLTYGGLMTGDVYSLSDFLARSGSSHNLGIALDLTLIDSQICQELSMQTAMHDLSRYSARTENNSNADLLSGFMTAAGFDTLFSEWWHFQDNATRYAIGQDSYRQNGITPPQTGE